MPNTINPEIKTERAMVDIAHDLLVTKGEPMMYAEIMQQVAVEKGYSAQQKSDMTPQLYTEVNIDGRFVCVGRNLWGLKDWFPLDQSTDSAVAANVKEDDFANEEAALDNAEDEEIDDLEEEDQD